MIKYYKLQTSLINININISYFYHFYHIENTDIWFHPPKRIFDFEMKDKTGMKSHLK